MDFIASMLQRVNDSVPIETYQKAAEDIVNVEVALAKVPTSMHMHYVVITVELT